MLYEYIDPSVRPSPAATALFGWLVNHLATYEAATTVDNGGDAPAAPPRLPGSSAATRAPEVGLLPPFPVPDVGG